MNAIPKPALLQELLIALAAECERIDPLSAGQEMTATAELTEALAVLDPWISSFRIVLQEARV
jgi:hypothetical protein